MNHGGVFPRLEKVCHLNTDFFVKMRRISLSFLIIKLLVSYSQCKVCPCKDASLCQPVEEVPEKEVLGFMIRSGNWLYYNWTELTTIAIFTDLNESMLNDLVCHAHAHKVRVVSHIGSEILKLSSKASRESYVTNLLDTVQSQYLDGVNIDAEDPVASGSEEELMLNVVTKEIYTRFKASSSSYQVSLDVAWSPSCIDGRCYDYLELSKWTDFLIIMAYDERSQIFDPGLCLAGANSDFVKTKQGIELYNKLGIANNKLVLGLPWYGYDYPCKKIIDEKSPCVIPNYTFRGANCSDGAGRQYGYSDIMHDFYPLSPTGLLYNKTAESPFFTYRLENGDYHQVWFDNPQSLAVKYGYAAEKKLGGIAFWNTDTLDYNSNTSSSKEQVTIMWNAIQAFLNN